MNSGFTCFPPRGTLTVNASSSTAPWGKRKKRHLGALKAWFTEEEQVVLTLTINVIGNRNRPTVGSRLWGDLIIAEAVA
jgi:hypothetical protein